MRTLWVAMALWALLAAGCGVPREAARLAAQEEAWLGAAADDAAVRAALAGQAEAWEAMADLAQRREIFGTAVDAEFIDLVKQTAALARRQRDLIAAGQDDPALNRQTLQQLRQLWADTRRYLGE
jgi:hypothetical protein